MNKTLITAKVNPDLDGVACMCAYSELFRQRGEDVTGGVFGKPHVEAQYLIDRFQIKDINYDPVETWEKFILVDASAMDGMPNVVRANDVIEVIDHRTVYEPEKTFPRAKIQNEKVGAAGTLITEKYYNSPIKISQNSTILLYGAIFSNTLNLKANVTTDRDNKAVEWLSKQAFIPEDLIHDMFTAKTKATEEDLEAVVESEVKEFKYGNTSFCIPQIEVLGAEKLVERKYKLILSLLDGYKQRNNLTFVFLSAIDLDQGCNYFVTSHPDGQKILSELFGVTFTNNVARRPGLILRKEIMPILKERLS